MLSTPAPITTSCAPESTPWAAAKAVDGRTRHLDGKAGDEDGGAPDVHALLAGLGYATDDHVIDLGRIDTGTLDDFGKRQRQQIVRPDGTQPAVASANSGSNGFNDDGVTHIANSLNSGIV